jgi:predicted naringenin-chalcone synthase
MPHLHLPTDHTDADLVLAANLADIVGSEDLYVAWSQETGAGVPEIEAYVSEEPPLSPFAERLLAFAAGCAAIWRALTGRPAHVAVAARSEHGAARQIEPSA